MKRRDRYTAIVFLLLCAACTARAGESYRAAAAGPVQDSLPVLIVETDDVPWGAWGGRGSAAVLTLTARAAGTPATAAAGVSFGAVLTAAPGVLKDPKGRHTVVLSDASGGGAGAPLLGMPQSNAWTLQGAVTDRMMLRNYLGHIFAGTIVRGGAPQVRYVEVVHKTPSGEDYLGLFLLGQYLERGVWTAGTAERDAAFIATFKPAPMIEPAATADAALAPLPDDGPGAGEIAGVIVPGLGAGDRQTAEEAILAVEALLYNDDPNAYFTAFDSLDLGSFIDSYLVKELFEQSGADQFSLCCDAAGRFTLRPRWNFDTALDNDPVPKLTRPVDLNSYTWFSRLILSYEVVQRMKTRYYELLRSGLRPERVAGIVDDTVIMLGEAMDRDWNRWRDAYLLDARARLQPARWNDRGQEFSLTRLAASPHEAVLQLKSELMLQARKMRAEVMERQWNRHQFDRSMDTVRNLLYAAAFMICFCVVTYIARRMV